ncbi:MAG TPA: hypothetical protein VFS00_02830, partial [Polyangiaceae bacterium]|nr:hypothetical protein [Polyangiaceae bacterium]
MGLLGIWLVCLGSAACGGEGDGDSPTGGPGGRAGSGGSAGQAGVAGKGGSAGQGGRAGAGGGPIDAVDLSGSYVVHSGPSIEGHASSLAPIRVDLRRDATGLYRAAVGVEGFPIAPFAVNASSDALELTGDVPAQASPPDSELIDDVRLNSLSLARGANGAFAGGVALSATYRLVTDGGDNSDFGSEMRFAARVVRDVTPPAWSLPPRYRKGPADVIFPWEGLRVALSEGALGSEVLRSLTLSVADAAGPRPLPGVAWTLDPAPDQSIAWAGAVGATARLADWSAVAGKSLLVEAQAIADLEGNRSAPLARPQAVAAVGVGDGPLTFDAPDGALFTWGDARLEAPGEGGSTAAACEAGGCLAMGPFLSPRCNLPVAGLAGRLRAAAGATKLVVRYRIGVEAPLPDLPGGDPTGGLSVHVTRPGGTTSSLERELTSL